MKFIAPVAAFLSIVAAVDTTVRNAVDITGTIRIDGVGITTSYLSSNVKDSTYTTTAYPSGAFRVTLAAGACLNPGNTAPITLHAPSLDQDSKDKYSYLGGIVRQQGPEPTTSPGTGRMYLNGVTASGGVSDGYFSSFDGEASIWTVECKTGLLSATWINKAKNSVPLQAVLESDGDASILYFVGNGASVVVGNPVGVAASKTVFVTLTLVSTP